MVCDVCYVLLHGDDHLHAFVAVSMNMMTDGGVYDDDELVHRVLYYTYVRKGDCSLPYTLEPKEKCKRSIS